MTKIGIAFPDFISTEKIKRRKNIDGFSKSFGIRYRFLAVLLLVVIALLIFRIFTLQIIEGKYYRLLSDTNRIKTVITHAPRGIIADRNGKPLVVNVPGFRLVENGKTRLLNQEQALSLISAGKKDLEIDSLRFYPEKDSTSHVLGYLGQITKEELLLEKYSGYRSGDLMGKMGIEEEYEGILRGIDGKQLVEIDSSGKSIRKLGENDPIPGRNIRLTMDLGLQKKAYDAMRGVKKGAVIVTTPKGEVLTLISKPTFDPNLFTQDDTYKTATVSAYRNVDQILSDEETQPLLNRAIAGLYPPGSTFKIITAASGINNKIIGRDYSIEDKGIIRIGEFSFANWYFTNYGRVDGVVNVVKGLARSNDIFFYELAAKIGVDRLSATAKDFMIGDFLRIDLAGGSRGLVPNPSWKEETIGEKWYLGDTYHYGIGQGYVLSTPLHVNSWAQTVAAKGQMYYPHLFKDSEKKDKTIKQNLLSEQATELITEGMIGACEKGGVAWPLFNLKIKNEKLKIDNRNFLKVATGSADLRQIIVACKTGTAQHGGEKTLPHAWITLFAPAYNPEIVITVLSEESGEGSSVAAPIAKEILTEWFSR